MKRVNIFVDMDTELVKGSETRTEGSSKRAGEELESENLKKQKLDENVEAEVDDDQEEAEMKKHMEIVPDDEIEKRFNHLQDLATITDMLIKKLKQTIGMKCPTQLLKLIDKIAQES
ncbi:hypothetical protein Tco_0005924 [Tanacetum coccineum]